MSTSNTQEKPLVVSKDINIPPKVLANALEKIVNENGKTVNVTHNKKNTVKIPIVNTSVKMPHSGPVPQSFLIKNGINIFHYVEGKRRVTIAYKYKKGDQSKVDEKAKRFVTYGATIFRNDTQGEVYCKNDHTWTAIRRLMNAPVNCTMEFYNIDQFKKQLRKFLFKKAYGVSRRKGTEHFHFETDNITNLTVAPAQSANETTSIMIDA